MKPSDIDADQWAGGVIASGCFLDGQGVDPSTVAVADIGTSGELHELTLRIAAEVVRFELGQSGVELKDAEALVEFVREDLRKAGQLARVGYLDFVRGIRKQQERRGILRKLFAAPKAPPIAWRWVSAEEVRCEGDVVVIQGKAVAADRR